MSINKNNNSSDEVLRTELASLGAREYEVVALTMDSDRGLAALALAREKGAERPVPYAIKVFDNPDWTPTNERPRRATNVHAEVKCSACDGDRFIVHRTRSDGAEEMKPCPFCNASLDAGFWKVDGSRFVVAK